MGNFGPVAQLASAPRLQRGGQGFEPLRVHRMFYTYILVSLKNGRYYYGSTNNISKRVEEHNNGLSKYTKSTRPFKLIYFEEYKTLKEARNRELYFKKLKNRKYLGWIIKNKKVG